MGALGATAGGVVIGVTVLLPVQLVGAGPAPSEAVQEAVLSDGLNPFILTNVALHTLNTLLLLGALLSLTGRFWASAMTAA